MCLLFCFVLFWILCCVVVKKNENKKLLITKNYQLSFQVIQLPSRRSSIEACQKSKSLYFSETRPKVQFSPDQPLLELLREELSVPMELGV